MAQSNPEALLPPPPGPAAIVGFKEPTIEEAKLQIVKIQRIVKEVMVEGEHYGTIPGTKKPTLFQAGSELFCWLFGLAPTYEIFETRIEQHLNITVKCRLWHRGSGAQVGEAMGSCSTMESKYAYRKAGRECPKCGNETIIKSKAQYGGGWLCFPKLGGCGAKFHDDDADILSQELGRKSNEDIGDAYNTVLKMGCKRAHAGAVKSTLALSGIFTTELEDRPYHPADDLNQAVEDPRTYHDRIAKAEDIETLKAIAEDLGPAELDQRDRAELREAYARKKLKLEAASGKGQRAAGERIVERNTGKSGY